MGLLSLLFGNKNRANDVVVIQKERSQPYNADKFKSDYNKYYSLLGKGPVYYKYSGRKADMPKFDDSYKTEEKYKLRELLLLVWWGKPKKGRKSNVGIPKYFFNSYNLNASKLTQKFFKNNLLEENGDKILLTEEGKKLYDKYKKLWEIHSFKGEATNLDMDFPNWDIELFTLSHYKNLLKYMSDENKYYQKMIDFLSNSLYPEDAEERIRDIEFYTDWRNKNLIDINDLKEKIEILEDK
ncbi:hypothetical protein [Streptococcus parauberis]|uniref:hypothetical protein n=1 Tax=Streptococcus parauberis TaxID=1348 RepID=UPI000C15715E|nr:hypothetical protein [Streptococcus parauberis]PIA83762.1 hypothetical protein ADO07_01631 [Streptococcus parauberis]